MRRFECTEDGSSKFWEVEVRGAGVWVRFGKLGTNGQEKLKDHGTADAAKREAEKLVAEKTKKGYVLASATATAPAAPAPASAPKAKEAKKSAAAPEQAKKAVQAPKGRGQGVRELLWQNPTDRDAMRVWADSLAEAGDPRGEFMQLKLLEAPTEAQSEKAAALEKKLGGKLVGPARPYTDYWSFDGNGMVNMIHCDGNKLVDGWEEIRWINPRLTLCLTTLRKQTMATIAKISALPLPEIYFLRIESGLTDRALAALAPALAGVRNLSLACNEITPAGLTAAAPHLESLEFLCLAPPVSERDMNAACNRLADAVAGCKPLQGLRAIHFFRHGEPDAAHLAMLRKMPNMKSALATFYPAYDADTIDAWKRGERTE